MLHVTTWTGRLQDADTGLRRLLAPRSATVAPTRRELGLQLAVVVLGSAAYGMAFGAWKSLDQAMLSGVKLPVVLLGTVFLCTAGNTVVVQALGVRLGLREVAGHTLYSLAVASAILGGLAPAAGFLSRSLAGPGTDGGLTSYRVLLCSHTLMVAIAGTAGTFRMAARLLRILDRPRDVAWVLLVFLCTGLLAGSQVSWFASPFLGRPGTTLAWVNPRAFETNFFEYLYHTASGR